MTYKKTIIKHASDFYVSYDDDGLISHESKKQFDKNGFITFPPGTIQKYLLDGFLLEANKYLANWDDGEIDLNLDDEIIKGKFKNSLIVKNVIYWGCPLQHRITRGYGSVFTEYNTNWLLGKRANFGTEFWNKKMASIIENSKIQSIAKSLLNADELSFHNGSASRTYPGSEGESRALHNDVSGFTRDPLSVVKKGHYVLNLFTYLSDTTEGLAPLKVIPESHKKHLRINEYISKNNNIYSEVNMMGKNQPLYEEMLPDDLKEPIKIIGEKGTIIAFRNDLLHATTANISKSEARSVLICNYANRKHIELFQQYRKERKEFANKINDKKLIESTFLGKHQKIFLRDIKRSIVGLKSNVFAKLRSKKAILLWLKNNIKHSYYRAPLPLDKRRYLNVGAGSNWLHPLFISTDQASGTSMSIDLSKPIPLPFNDNRFLNIYSSHFFEHLKYSESQYLMKELYRCLDKDGILRIVVPDIEKYLDAYEQKNTTAFIYSSRGSIYQQDSCLRFIIRQFAEPVVDKYSDDELYDMYNKMEREDFLAFFESQVNHENDERLLIPDAHKTWYSGNRMKNLLLESGFNKVTIMEPNKSDCKTFVDNYRQLDGVKPGRNLLSLFIEATKE